MARIPSGGRQGANVGRRSFAAFTGGDEYDPQPSTDGLDQPDTQPQVSDAKAPADEGKAAPPPSADTPAAGTPPAPKPVRKNWAFSQDFINELLKSKADWAYSAVEEGRHIRYGNVAEQAWIAALATCAMEQLAADLKQGPSHGLAGEIHKYFPENSRAVRGYN